MTIANPGPLNQQAPYLPPEFDIPKDGKSLQEWIAVRERLTGTCLNIREIAIYETTQVQTGQQWFSVAPAGQPQNKRFTFRQVFQTGAIAQGATATINHLISVPAGSTLFFTKIYGVAQTTNVDWRPIPYASISNVNQQIDIKVTSTQIIVINGAAAANISSGIVVLEWLLY